MIGFSSAPALAGHYEMSDPIYNGSSTPASIYDPSPNPPTSWADGAPLNAYDYYYGSASGGGRNAAAASSGSIKYVFTWVPDDADDAPPDKVWVNESASAYWEAHIDGAQWHSMTGQPCPIDTSFSGIGSDGLGGTYVPDAPNPDHGVMGGHCESSRFIEVTGGASFSRTCSPSATASASGGQYWRGGVTVSVNYSVNIIATPYDFKVAPDYPQMPGDGVLEFQYTWKSTSGNLADLSDVLVYEHVDYPGGTPTYYPPNAPFNFFFHNPTDWRFDGYANALRQEDGSAGTFVDYGPDTHNHGALLNAAGTFTATQEFRWHKPAIHGLLADDKYNVMKGLYGESHPITRTVSYLGNGHYRYRVTKHFAVAELIYQ